MIIAGLSFPGIINKLGCCFTWLQIFFLYGILIKGDILCTFLCLYLDLGLYWNICMMIYFILAEAAREAMTTSHEKNYCTMILIDAYQNWLRHKCSQRLNVLNFIYFYSIFTFCIWCHYNNWPSGAGVGWGYNSNFKLSNFTHWQLQVARRSNCLKDLTSIPRNPVWSVFEASYQKETEGTGE